MDLSKKYGKDNLESFNEVFDKFYQKLLYFAWKMVKSKDTALDITTDAFIKLYISDEDFLNESRVFAFLRTIVKRSSLNARDKSTKDFKRGMKFLELPEEEHLEENPINIVAFQQKEKMLDKMYEAISELPEGCREVLTLLFLENCSLAEVSAKLDISINTVKAQRANGLKKARKKLLEFLAEIDSSS